MGEENLSCSKILSALNEVMTRVGYVKKDKKNNFHGYKYAGEGALLKTLRPAMVEAGLILIPSMTSASEVDQHGNTMVKVEYTLAHKSGEVWPEKITAFGCGNDKNKNGVGDKGVYKGLTGANKYFLFKLFQIETGDDPEKENGTTDNPTSSGQNENSQEDIPIQGKNSTTPGNEDGAFVSTVVAEGFINLANAIGLDLVKDVKPFLQKNNIQSEYEIPVNKIDLLRKGLRELKPN